MFHHNPGLIWFSLNLGIVLVLASIQPFCMKGPKGPWHAKLPKSTAAMRRMNLEELNGASRFKISVLIKTILGSVLKPFPKTNADLSLTYMHITLCNKQKNRSSKYRWNCCHPFLNRETSGMVVPPMHRRAPEFPSGVFALLGRTNSMFSLLWSPATQSCSLQRNDHGVVPWLRVSPTDR